MYYFCTYFDQRYLPRGLALYRSLKQHCPLFKLWVLCLDDACYEVLSQLKDPGIHLLALEQLERDDEELFRTKRNRTLIEYYFTCTPSLPLYIFDHFPEVECITYLDADLFFFNSPTAVYDEISDKSIAIIGHRHPPHLKHMDMHGLYNVGWVTFKRDEHALECLHWWRDKCIEWCYDRVEDERFADQKYLDDWPKRFKKVVVIEHKGANLAPWNLANYKIRERQKTVWVDEQPLIFFHFHGLKQVNSWLYDLNFAPFALRASRIVRRKIYGAYVRTLIDIVQVISPYLAKVSVGRGIREGIAETGLPRDGYAAELMATARWRWHISKEIIARRYLAIKLGLVL